MKAYWKKIFFMVFGLCLVSISGANAVGIACRVRAQTGLDGVTLPAGSTTLTCGGGYTSSATLWLERGSDVDYDSSDEIAICVCPSDITKVIEYHCHMDGTKPVWTPSSDGCTTYSGTLKTCGTNQQLIGGFCTNLCEANSNEGYVLKVGSLDTYVQ